MRLLTPPVRESLPVEGRITLELFDERGRLRHRTRADNALSGQFVEAIKSGLRGQPANQASNIGYVGYDQAEQTYGTNVDDRRKAGSADPHIYARHYQFMNGIYLSSADDAVDDSWWYPLGLEAGARITENNSFTDNKKRGGRQLGLFTKSPSQTRLVVDFGLAIANGFSVESVGLMGMRFPNTDTYDGVYGWVTGSIDATPGSGYTGLGGVHVRSWAKVSDSKIWVYGEDGAHELDFTLSTAFHATSGNAIRSIQGPTLATLGSPSATNGGIAIIGTDFWLMDTTRLRRMTIPTNTSAPTTNNTYSPVTGFTDAACLGLCTDGTDLYAIGSTKVFVISATTGAVTSSWTHNVTNARNIHYDEVHDIVWIVGSDCTSYGRDSYQTTSRDIQQYEGDIAHGSSLPYNAMPFSKAGTALGYGTYPYFSNSVADGVDALVLADQCRILAECTVPAGANLRTRIQSGGMLGSRALVDSPFTKTSSDVLRVTYDLLFAELP